jgi:peptidoglycan/LPS O-acetylase OafA/YrhL
VHISGLGVRVKVSLHSANDRYPPLSEQAARSHAEALDGLRGCSILFVLISHYWLPIVPGGFGVTVFFFVSGFLISRLLITELNDNRTIAIQDFYIRRVLRLAPALLLFILLVGLAWYFTFNEYNFHAAFAAIFYYFNYYSLYAEMPFEPYGVLWSLSVEEHFYLLFPLFILSYGKNLVRVLKLLVVFCLVALLWRCLLTMFISSGSLELPFSHLKYSTDSRFDALIYGVLLSVSVQVDGVKQLCHKVRSEFGLIAGLLLIVAGLVLKLAPTDSHLYLAQYYLRYVLTGIGLFLSLNYVLFADRAYLFRGILSNAILRYVGKISYSLYLWHMAVLMYINRIFDPGWLAGTISAALVSVLLAVLSYHLVELYFVKLRRKFGSNI